MVVEGHDEASRSARAIAMAREAGPKPMVKRSRTSSGSVGVVSWRARAREVWRTGGEEGDWVGAR